MWSLMNILPGNAAVNILDIGAALGETPPYQSFVDAGRAKIFGFEPNQEEHEKLRAKYGKQHRFLPYFAGDGGKAVYYETNWPPTGSLLEPNLELLGKFNNMAELSQTVARHEVETKRIDDMDEIKDVDFIKIDVQGGELAVLSNAGRALASAVCVQAEVEFVELYKGQPMFADIDAFLRANGFQFHTFDGFGTRAFRPLVFNGNVNAGLRQYLWSDAIYVRDWMRLDQLSEIKLKKYALLAHDLLKSYDLAYHVLLELDRKSGKSHAADYLKRLSGGQASP